MNELISNKKKWELLFDYVMTLNYEETILHQDISKILKEPYGSTKYQAAISRAKKSLLKQGKAIESINGQGYRVIKPDNYVAKAVSIFRQGFNKLDTANEILIYTPIAHMSDDGRTAYRNVTDRIRILHATMAGGCTELNLLAKRPSALLPENISRN